MLKEPSLEYLEKETNIYVASILTLNLKLKWNWLYMWVLCWFSSGSSLDTMEQLTRKLWVLFFLVMSSGILAVELKIWLIISVADTVSLVTPK